MADAPTTNHDEIASPENTRYRRGYGKMVSFLMMLVMLMVILMALFLLVTFMPQQPRYYATTTHGEVYPMSSLTEPVVTDAYLRSWVSTIAGGVFTVSFDAWKDQLKKYQPDFTDLAWQSLMNSYTKGGFAKTLEGSQLVASAVVTGTPQILDRRIISGRYTWFVTVPVMISYTSASAQAKQQVNLSLTVSRVPVLSIPQGIQISQFNAKLMSQGAG